MKYIICLSLVLMSGPVSAEDISFCRDGWSLTESGNHSKAIDLFNQCIESGKLSNSSLARTYRNIGIASNRMGQHKEAIKSYDKAISLNPYDPWDDYVNRGNARSGLGEYDKAFDDYNIALAIKPNYNQAFYNRGIVFEKMGDNKKAVEEFKKAYKNGLRSKLLNDRIMAHGLVKKN